MAEITTIAVVVGLVAGIALIVIFATIFPLTPVSHPRDIVRIVPVVIIPEGAAIDKNFEPATIEVVIGTNSTVRWVNQDSVPSSIIADDDSDPDFYNATKIQCENDDQQNCVIVQGKNTLMPGRSFEFTFRQPGVFGYHSVPHPWMQGTVVVLEDTQQKPQKVDLDNPLVAYPCEYVVISANSSGTFYTCPHPSEINNIVIELPSPVYKKALCTGPYGCARPYNYMEIVPPNLLSEQQRQLVIDKIMNLSETKLNSGWTLDHFIIQPKADRWFANVQLFLPSVKQLPPSQECGWYGSVSLDLETLEIIDIGNIPPRSDVKC